MNNNTILVDFDDTIAMSTKTIFDIYKKETGFKGNYHRDYLWNFDGLIDKSYLDRALSLFQDKLFYSNLTLKKDCKKVLKFLNDMGFNICICSMHKNPVGRAYKDEWISRKLPFIKDRIYLDSFDKSIVEGFMIIDDKPECLIGDRKYKLLFGNYGYNKHCNDNDIIRVFNWNRVEKFILDNILLRK